MKNLTFSLLYGLLANPKVCNFKFKTLSSTYLSSSLHLCNLYKDFKAVGCQDINTNNKSFLTFLAFGGLRKKYLYTKNYGFTPKVLKNIKTLCNNTALKSKLRSLFISKTNSFELTSKINYLSRLKLLYAEKNSHYAKHLLYKSDYDYNDVQKIPFKKLLVLVNSTLLSQSFKTNLVKHLKTLLKHDVTSNNISYLTLLNKDVNLKSLNRSCIKSVNTGLLTSIDHSLMFNGWSNFLNLNKKSAIFGRWCRNRLKKSIYIKKFIYSNTTKDQKYIKYNLFSALTLKTNSKLKSLYDYKTSIKQKREACLLPYTDKDLKNTRLPILNYKVNNQITCNVIIDNKKLQNMKFKVYHALSLVDASPSKFYTASWLLESLKAELSLKNASIKRVLKNTFLKSNLIVQNQNLVDASTVKALNVDNCFQSQSSVKNNIGFSYDLDLKNALIKHTSTSLFKGLRITISGRFGGKKGMAKTLTKTVGKVPLSTLEEKVDFAKDQVITKNGSLGVKVWICYN